MRRRRRRLNRYASRMVGGARRPPPPNYISIICKLLNQVIKIDERLRPFMEEQARLLRRLEWEDKYMPILRQVYSDDPPSEPTPENSKPVKKR